MLRARLVYLVGRLGQMLIVLWAIATILFLYLPAYARKAHDSVYRSHLH